MKEKTQNVKNYIANSIVRYSNPHPFYILFVYEMVLYSHLDQLGKSTPAAYIVFGNRHYAIHPNANIPLDPLKQKKYRGFLINFCSSK